MKRRDLLLSMLCLPVAANAAPRVYRLDPAGSMVGFSYVLAGLPGKGTMPISEAALQVDFSQLSASKADVRLDASGTRAGNGLITDALKGPEMLDTARHPNIRFISRKVEGSVRAGARIAGDVTIRGITKPLTLDARLYRGAGTVEGDLSRLAVHLTGAINRYDFGVDGYRDLVGDRIELNIRTQLVEVN